MGLNGGMGIDRRVGLSGRLGRFRLERPLVGVGIDRRMGFNSRLGFQRDYRLFNRLEFDCSLGLNRSLGIDSSLGKCGYPRRRTLNL